MRKIQLVAVFLLLFRISPAQHKLENKDDKHHHRAHIREAAMMVFYCPRKLLF